MNCLKTPSYFLRFSHARKEILNKYCAINVTNHYCTANAVPSSEKMTEKIKLKFPSAKQIEVEDVSSGCGYMFRVFVESKDFKGLNTVKQHKLINEVLKDDIKLMHGIRIETKVPDEDR